MKTGDALVLHVDKLNPDFKKEFNLEESFPGDKIFNFGEWRRKEMYKTIVKEDEDVDVFGNKGWMEMKEEFTIVILCAAGDEKHKKEVMDNLPHL
eukprot:CAMPEP_0170547996 /NCGR_PEP_ID=MMETSP0211-20121228/6316_1 /TAXON_ID=311385 /ORGANISM="Pseudokeronopsis sp., Strain OXSARD2" /LENGTH=94 /DNA_ID=CAMNT_0010853273 /DNA_START=115 /DNA_END=396 /DNA_ORIENTATION=+